MPPPNREKIQFVVSVGDNFYEDGVQSTTDPKWATSFGMRALPRLARRVDRQLSLLLPLGQLPVTVNMYTGEALQKRWYQMLGNHDYQGNVSFHLHLLRPHKLANAEC